MPRVTHFYSHREEGESLIVYLPGEAKPFVALGDHPNFAGLKLAAEDDDLDTIIELRELAKSIAARFARLGDRVTTRDRRLYFDGDEVHNTLTDQILKFYDEGEDFKPLVNLFERLAFNPSQNSKDQLYNWISNHNGITVMSDGRLVAYKGVSHGDAGNYRSTQQGHGFVNDVEYTNSYLPYALGDDVRMPRSEVTDDPYASCSTGLHVGTFEYAQTWSRSGVMLRVAVDPADVVSVPTDGSGEKIRVCRFTIEEIVNEPVSTLVFNTPEEQPEEEERPVEDYMGLDEDIFVAHSLMTDAFDRWAQEHPDTMPPTGYIFDGRKGEAADFSEGDLLTLPYDQSLVWSRGTQDAEVVHGTCLTGTYDHNSSILSSNLRGRFPYLGLVKVDTPVYVDRAPYRDDPEDFDDEACTECGCHLDYCTCGDEEYCFTCGESECCGDCEDGEDY